MYLQMSYGGLTNEVDVLIPLQKWFEFGRHVELEVEKVVKMEARRGVQTISKGIRHKYTIVDQERHKQVQT